MFKTVLLDVDNTLLDFDACEKTALEQVFKNYKYDLNEDILNLYVKINSDLWKEYEKGTIEREDILNTRFTKLFMELDIEEDGIKFEKEYRRLLGEGHVLVSGAIEILEYLVKKYDLYVVTNGIKGTQNNRLKLSGIKKYMKDIFISEEVGYQKPRKEFFDYCFEKIGKVDLSKTIIIGDSLSSDIKGGNNTFISTCWYNPKGEINNTNNKVDYEIRELVELRQFL